MGEKLNNADGQTFEQSLEELETILSELENSKVPLDKLVEKYSRGLPQKTRCGGTENRQIVGRDYRRIPRGFGVISESRQVHVKYVHTLKYKISRRRKSACSATITRARSRN